LDEKHRKWADFDGDAMNVLFPRSASTRNEIEMLASPAQFFISYKDGAPKIGQVQDSLIGLVALTTNGTVVGRSQAMRMFRHAGLCPNLATWPKDYKFNGRELVSIYLQNRGYLINLTAKPSFYIAEHMPYRTYDPTDIKVEIDRGQLISGVLDKSTVGQDTANTIYHLIHNQYGPDAGLNAAFEMQQIANSMNEWVGFTMHSGDLILNSDSMTKIHSVEASLIAAARRVTDQLNTGRMIPPVGKTVSEYYEEQQIAALKPGDEFFEPVFKSIDLSSNNFFRSVIHSIKGKEFNFTNTVCAMGQIEINGERMRESFSGRTLPYFTRNDPDPMSRGYITNSYATGISPAEFFFHAADSRYAIISKALSTSVTGMHNRMAIKSLEAIIIDNMRKATNGQHVTQFLYGADGADPRFSTKVKFPTMAGNLSTAAFAEKFHCKAAGNEGDAEFAALQADREFFIDLQFKMERLEGDRTYIDALPMPVNPHRIIEDTLYNLGLKHGSTILAAAKKIGGARHTGLNGYGGIKIRQVGGKSSPTTTASLDPIQTILKVRELCDTIHYCLVNEIQRRKRAEVPPHLVSACHMLRILIRSYLNVSYLQTAGVTDAALDIIIEQIRASYVKSLINYGKTMGIIASQSISEPMTQTVLDSHHNAGGGSTKKKGMFRIREILGARPTKDMKTPSMTLQVLPEYRTDKVLVQDIANRIEQLPLSGFMKEWQIFFERYGKPQHPNYVDEAKFISEFDKLHAQIKPPSDLTNWCVRIVLDKSKLIEKDMRIDVIYRKIRSIYPSTYVVYSANNADTAIMRIYLSNTFSKKAITLETVTDFVVELRDLVVRGVPGVKAAYVKEGKRSVKTDDGSITSEKYYYLFTDGTNLERILENPYIDPNTVQSDSIQEMLELFGIGAACQKIRSELKHQIPKLSNKHYAVYADEMTSTGTISQISRHGSAARKSSALQRISDANPINVIEETASINTRDKLTGISPAIMMGKSPRVGDLYNTFLINESFVKANVKNLESILEAL